MIHINASSASLLFLLQGVHPTADDGTKMYKNILVPVDLEHQEQVSKAMAVGTDLAKHYGASITIVSVTTAAPSAVAHNPEEFQSKLEQFASERSKEFGIEIASKIMLSHDPTVDIDDTIQKAASELNTDLVVMGSHVPGFMEYVFASRAGYLASHADMSVLVVR
ncbi:MAG: universal stress protein [Hyphomicrobiaceae bacterium]